jgi:hypothetical protein
VGFGITLFIEITISSVLLSKVEFVLFSTTAEE